MDIIIQLKVLDNGRLQVGFEDKRQVESIKWEKEMSCEQFMQEVTRHLCSTNPIIADFYPVGFHIQTKEIDYSNIEKEYAKHHNMSKYRWEPEYKGLFDILGEKQKNKYTQKEREIFVQLCILCGHIDTVSEMFRVPETTLKTWLYKAGKRRKNYQYEWYNVLVNAPIDTRIKILSDGYPVDVISKLTKLSEEVIKKIVKDNQKKI